VATTEVSGRIRNSAASSPLGDVRPAGPAVRNPTPESRRKAGIRNSRRGFNEPAGIDLPWPLRPSDIGLPSVFRFRFIGFRQAQRGFPELDAAPDPELAVAIAVDSRYGVPMVG
jgi:hypothetical protein